jgi:lipopolysaccharide/colanic/teichoic acid biosynthesis glycosyltransferase
MVTPDAPLPLTTARCSAAKRLLDVVLAAGGLVAAAPVVGVAAVLVKVTSPGPVLHRQTRIGRDGVPFRLYKLRSMYVGCDQQAHAEYLANFVAGTVAPVDGTFKRLADSRVTPVGRVLRRYSIDELPQLWNVLRGDMSIVGPRPPLPVEADLYDSHTRQRLAVRPGLTGLWQVSGRAELSFREMVALDLRYVRTSTMATDLRIIARTLPAVLSRRGAG